MVRAGMVTQNGEFFYFVLFCVVCFFAALRCCAAIIAARCVAALSVRLRCGEVR